jgi:hypothetical protein
LFWYRVLTCDNWSRQLLHVECHCRQRSLSYLRRRSSIRQCFWANASLRL